MKDAQGTAAIKCRVLEESRPLQPEQRNLLNDLTHGIFILASGLRLVTVNQGSKGWMGHGVGGWLRKYLAKWRTDGRR